MAGVLEQLIRQQNRVVYRSLKAMELEAAKEILAEVFHTRPADIEDMIQRRLEERSWPEENRAKLWPATFCLSD